MGTIAGWTMDNNLLYRAPSRSTSDQSVIVSGVGLCQTGDAESPVFWAGFQNTNSYNLNFKTPHSDSNWETRTQFYVTNNGEMCAKKGKIGDWILNGNVLKSGETIAEDGVTFMCTGTSESNKYTIGGHKGTGWVFGAGKNFGVTKNGKLYCTEATIQGTLKAGTIINNGSIIGTNKYCKIGNTTSWEGFIGNSNNNSGLAIGFSSGGKVGLGNILATDGAFITINNGGCGYKVGNWHEGVASCTCSDINLKHQIEAIPLEYESLLDNLKPVRYKYNDGTSDRYHIGFIAQEVAEALDVANIDSKDFAGLVIFDQGTKDEHWALRYEEFIALNTAAIQKLKSRVAELEDIVEKLQQKEE
jgi:hypothetical protein